MNTPAPPAPPMVLVHGGIGEPMNAERFWHRPGVVAGLEAAGCHVAAPDRNTAPTSWSDGAAELASLITQPAFVVAGSNGCSVALRLAIERPALVTGLVLAWPAVGDDPELDSMLGDDVRHLLGSTTIRGVTDEELRALALPVTVIGALPQNRVHPVRTVERLAELVPDGRILEPGCPEAPRPDFAPYLDRFVAQLLSVAVV